MTRPFEVCVSLYSLARKSTNLRIGSATYILITDPEELLVRIECEGTGRSWQGMYRMGRNGDAMQLFEIRYGQLYQNEERKI